MSTSNTVTQIETISVLKMLLFQAQKSGLQYQDITQTEYLQLHSYMLGDHESRISHFSIIVGNPELSQTGEITPHIILCSLINLDKCARASTGRLGQHKC